MDFNQLQRKKSCSSESEIAHIKSGKKQTLI